MTNTLESLTLQILNNAHQASPRLMQDFLLWESFYRQIGVLICVVLCSVLFVYARKFWKKGRYDEDYKLASVACSIFIVLFMIFGFTEFITFCKIKYSPELYVVEKVISKIKQ